MKVYVVHAIYGRDGDGDLTSIEKIFTTKDAAIKFIAENNKDASLVEKPTEYELEE